MFICSADIVFTATGIAEVMSLVTGLAADAEAGSQEVTGPTDPIRVMVTHTLQPDSSSISFSVELLSRLTADIKGLVLRYDVNKLNDVCLEGKGTHWIHWNNCSGHQSYRLLELRAVSSGVWHTTCCFRTL